MALESWHKCTQPPPHLLQIPTSKQDLKSQMLIQTSLISRPLTQLSVPCSAEKWERTWYSSSHESSENSPKIRLKRQCFMCVQSTTHTHTQRCVSYGMYQTKVLFLPPMHKSLGTRLVLLLPHAFHPAYESTLFYWHKAAPSDISKAGIYKSD